MTDFYDVDERRDKSPEEREDLGARPWYQNSRDFYIGGGKRRIKK